MSRRDALTVLGGSLAALGVPAARAADLPLVHVGVIPIYSVAQHYAADAQGYFAAEGIAVTTQPVQGGAIGIPGLVSGSFDVLYTNSLSVLTALERGIDLRIVAEGTPIPSKPPDADALFKRKGEDIKNGKDLEGKVIGINTRFTAQWLVMQGWAQKTGGDLSKITYREVPLPAMLDALKSKQVDVALLLDPFMSIAFADPNYELLGWPSSMILPNMPSSFWIVNGATADTKPDLVRAYVRGYIKGVQWVNAHIGDQAYLDLVASYTHTDVKLLAKMYTSKQLTDINPDAIKSLISVMQDYDLLKTNVEIDSKIFKA